MESNKLPVDLSKLIYSIVKVQAMLEVSIELQCQLIADQNGSDRRKIREDVWNDVRVLSEDIFENLTGQQGS